MTPKSLGALAEAYDAFLVDQHGVLLKGNAAYPGAAEALSELAARNKRVVLLSNSGKRSRPNVERLLRLGFDPTSFITILSSGEAAYAVLADRIGHELRFGAKVLVLSRDGDLSGIDGLALEMTEDPGQADLILIAGSRGEELPLDFYEDLLSEPAGRRVPALCTNPDLIMLTDKGSAFGAGRIAERYAALGGPVEYIGKPHPLIYRVARQHIGDVDPLRILCVGDSPDHDILGAKRAGFSAALVLTGIHADQPLESLLGRCTDLDALPDHVLTAFHF
jgi:HAD superfamily hydrolase (TIGR01459 family)